jgi:hypothetical protein
LDRKNQRNPDIRIIITEVNLFAYPQVAPDSRGKIILTLASSRIRDDGG